MRQHFPQQIIISPHGQRSFEFWIDRTDYDVGEIIHIIQGADGDQDEISYSLISGNVDRDGDGNLLLGVSHEGLVSVVDPDEIFLSSGNTFKVVISLSDHGGRIRLLMALLRLGQICLRQ